MEISNKKTIAIVGGGMLGITAALSLAKNSNYRVTLIEKSDILGGLSTYFSYENTSIDKYYHVILPQDTALLELFTEIDVSKNLYWVKTNSGFFGNNRLASLSSVLDFAAFPFLNLWQKFRLVMGILYSTRLKNTDALDTVPVTDWLKKVFGKGVYESIWLPLLKSKLGTAYDKASASFIWSTIRRLYGARESGKKEEKMGYIEGGYRAVINELENSLIKSGVTIKKKHVVLKIDPDEMKISYQSGSDNSDIYDSILITVPSPIVGQILDVSLSSTVMHDIMDTHYLGLVCVVVLLRRSLSSYYVINLLDQELPFTGVIESTNIVNPSHVGGYHLVYLPKYMPTEELSRAGNDEEIIKIFLDGLKKIFKDLNDNDIIKCFVFREKYIQPVQALGYCKKSFSFNTDFKNIFIANSAMLFNTTLNNNAIVMLGNKAADAIINKLT